MRLSERRRTTAAHHPERRHNPDRRRHTERRCIALADQLLGEIAQGHHPVWPSTLPYARSMARGLAHLAATRGFEVARAILIAPEDTQIDWRAILLSEFAHRSIPRHD